MSGEIYNNLEPQEIIVLGYLSALREWGMSSDDVPSISSQVCCGEITWDTSYDIIDTTNKIWGISYYQSNQ